MAKKKNIDDEILGEDKEKEEEKNNKQMDMESIRKLINKEAGKTIAFNLENEDPTTVKKWIKTGSRVLDSIISRGMYSGVPVGRIVELAGLESSGKSFVAAGICKNAIENGFKVAYFDSESAIDKNFWNKIGIDTNEILYLQAISIESVLETIEKLISLGQPFLYVLDSLANCASKKRLDTEGFDPQAIMAMDARILSQGFKKF
jgi:recombination protein RecA